MIVCNHPTHAEPITHEQKPVEIVPSFEDRMRTMFDLLNMAVNVYAYRNKHNQPMTSQLIMPFVIEGVVNLQKICMQTLNILGVAGATSYLEGAATGKIDFIKYVLRDFDTTFVD